MVLTYYLYWIGMLRSWGWAEWLLFWWSSIHSCSIDIFEIPLYYSLPYMLYHWFVAVFLSIWLVV